MHIKGVLRVFHPRHAKAVPLLVDSPHSGRVYPDDFAHTCPRRELQVYEDRFLDLLLTNLPHIGCTVLQAEAPRSYIDLNRACDDIAPEQVSGGWRGPYSLKPSINSRRGTGLVWTRAYDTHIYDALPSGPEIEKRIETYYWPYYAALECEAARIKERFGAVWHLNMHSMPPETNNGAYDVVLGDHDGQSCDAPFIETVERAFTDAGLRVTRNDPYKGAHLTRTMGQPETNSESLQIELSKALYLKGDLVTLDSDRFQRLQGVIEKVVAAAAVFARSQVSNTVPKAALSAESSSSIGMFRP